ncbi:MAG TPA: hypothetical protein VM925_38060 [Labilithrix sp.]|nr:hypothetical protein [Labilithrix sp.]
MKTRLLSLVLSATAFVACSSPASNGSSSGQTNEEPATGEETPGETTPDPGSSSGDPATTTPPGIASASVRNIGRHGDTIRIQVSGTDAAKQTSAARVRFTDANDAPVDALDTDWDAIPDAPERTFHFDKSTLGSASFEGTITIPSAFASNSKIKKAFIALENEAGTRSTEVSADLVEQLVKAEGEACDAQKIESRCDDGLACSGTPAVCQPGSAPVLSKVAYYGGATPKMLFRGDEADEDIASISVEFLDNASNAKNVVISGEGEDAVTANNISVDARGSGFGTTYFVEAFPATSFVSQVPKIAATAVDIVGRSSTRTITALSAIPTRNVGQSCDPDGFDTCASNSVCAPGIRTETNTCKSASTTRTAKCKATAALDPAKAPARTFGTVAGVSLWDPPVGCVPNDAVGRPEAAIPLHLGAAAPSLTITTALPETNFDTAVYVIPSCAASSANALGCNDDVKGYSSTLTLKDVPAGDYTIIVESVQMRGGQFGIAVTLE